MIDSSGVDVKVGDLIVFTEPSCPAQSWALRSFKGEIGLVSDVQKSAMRTGLLSLRVHFGQETRFVYSNEIHVIGAS